MITSSWDFFVDEIGHARDIRKDVVVYVLNGEGKNKDYVGNYVDLRGHSYTYTRAGVTLIVAQKPEHVLSEINSALHADKHVVFVCTFDLEESIKEKLFAKNFKYIEAKKNFRLDLNYHRPTTERNAWWNSITCAIGLYLVKFIRREDFDWQRLNYERLIAEKDTESFEDVEKECCDNDNCDPVEEECCDDPSCGTSED